MICAVFLIRTKNMNGLKGASGPVEAMCGAQPRDAEWWLRPFDGNKRALLLVTPEEIVAAERLEDWITWIRDVTSKVSSAELSEDCLVWFHASDFPEQWRDRFPGVSSGLGVLAKAEVGLGAQAKVLMSSRVRIGPVGAQVDVEALVNAIARPEAADEVRKGLCDLRELADASSDAPKVPAPEDMLSMRLSFWRHELFRTAGALKWDLELDSESSRSRARAGAEPAADRIKAVCTEIKVDTEKLPEKYAGEGNGEVNPRAALMALTNALKDLEDATRHLASGELNDHKDRFSESLKVARVKFAEATAAAESVRAQAARHEGGQP